MKPAFTNALWVLAGTAFFASLIAIGLRTRLSGSELRTRQLQLVTSIRTELAAQSEAEKSAVLAPQKTSQTFADQARAYAKQVETDRDQLDELLKKSGNQRERALLAEFSNNLSELERVDHEILELAVKDTNLRAYELAFGPAADAVKEMDVALSKLMGSESKKVALLSARALVATLRIQAMLAPHIAEEDDAKMGALEAAMAREDAEVQQHLKELPPEAAAAYARFSTLRKQILKLSRENTNVRSLSLSLNQKRKLLLACQEPLAALEQQISQSIPGTARPR
jgi:hypothetical protein